MGDPTMKRCRVIIEYRASDGHSVAVEFKSTPSTDSLTTLAEAHRETARLLSLFGAPDRAQDMTADALHSVGKWRVGRARNPEAA
mgnify:CR=1 FL=1